MTPNCLVRKDSVLHLPEKSDKQQAKGGDLVKSSTSRVLPKVSAQEEGDDGLSICLLGLCISLLIKVGRPLGEVSLTFSLHSEADSS